MTVESEKWCGENRLDIAIMEDNIIKIAIEAKINAEENHKTSLVGKGSSQLRKYDKWLKKNKQHQNCKKFF